MNILDTILNAQGGAAVQQVGSQLGLSADQTAAALGALVPALAAGLQQNAQTAGGLGGLIGALTGGRHSQYLDNTSTLGDQDTIDDGNGILGHVFGSKEVSREVASRAASQTGISADILKKMLPIAATLVMSSLARQHHAALRAPRGVSVSPGGDLLNTLSNTLGGSSGAIANDVAGMLGRLLGPKA